MSSKIDIIALARKKGIDEEIIQSFTKRELCALINSMDEKLKLDCENQVDDETSSADSDLLGKMQWNILRVVEKKAKTSIVEWMPTCATRKELKIYQENFDIESVDDAQIHVKWKNSSIPTCVSRAVYEKEKANVEKVLNSDAVLIHWPNSEVDNSSIRNPKATASAAIAATEEPKEKRRRVCAPDKDVERVYVPALENLVAQPGFPSDESLVQAGLKMQSGPKKEAANVFSKFWRDSVGDEFSKLYYIDNLGNGDCMYYALAPMVRALKPNLFEQEVNEDNDMIRLRQLLATKIGKTAADINSYLSIYESNFGSEAQKKAFRKENPPLRTKPPFTALDNVEQRRLKLQNDLVQPDHWAHLNDFNLLHELLGPSVHIVIFETNYKKDVPPFHLVENAQKATPNSKYVFIVHSGDHFVRLQQKSGKFAFSEKEFNEDFPLISALYNNLLSPSNVNLELVRLQDDIFKQYPTLRAAIPSQGEYDTFYYKFLGIAKNRESEVVEKIIPQIQRYSSLDATEKLLLRNRLLGNDGRQGATQEELARLAQEKVDQFVARTNVITIPDDVARTKTKVDARTNVITIPDDKDEPFCAPLTEEEGRQFDKVIFAAEKNINGEVLKINDVSVTGDWILRLKPGRWMNGDIVQLYIELLVKDHNAIFQDKIATVSTYLYEEISKKGLEKVKRWKNPLDGGPLSKLFIPINIEAYHWFLSVVDFNKKEIQFYDSSCSVADKKQTYAENIKAYLKSLPLKNVLDFKGLTIGSHLDLSAWKVDIKSTPQQTNGSDCGVFVMAFAMQLQSPSFDGFTFTQADMPCFRKRILLRLIAASSK